MVDNKTRCGWCGNDELYIKYHNEEWGVPIRDDHRMYEFLLLETFQAGLSWITILKRRHHFKKAFANFQVEKVAKFTPKNIEELLNNEGIIRNKLKVHAAITNAQIFIAIQKEFGSFCNYIWGFQNNKVVKNKLTSLAEIKPYNDIALQISKDLKKRGMKFVGPTIIYAHMQACGMVNDHLVDCFRYQEV